MAEEQARMMGKFRANADIHNSNSANKINKRIRQPLSCLPCRQRKLKCDRAHPCETCLKRNDDTSCVYSRVPNPGNNNVASRAKAQDRLRQLEQLVMQMVDTNGSLSRDPSSRPPTSPSDVTEDDTPVDGRLEQNGKYVGSTHWSAILENINELKSAMVDEGSASPEVEDGNEADSPDQEILFGSSKALSAQQILSQHLLPRIQVDRLLSTYFNAKYMVIPYIHTYHFQKQYERFWLDSSQVDALWLSVLFSICCIASQLTAATTSIATVAEEAKAQIKSFLVASAQCLILGGYTRPKPYVVEALALHAQCKYNATLDPSREVGIIFPMLIRLAYRMGYHRDPDNFENFSVFEGEMRRRVWTMCRQFDLMTSFQLGLPNSIPMDSWDTKPPRNLLDADFAEDTKTLPASRPESEPTQILYFIVKSRLMTNFGRICNHALSFKNSSQTEVLALDADIRQTFATVPDTLRIRPMSQSFADPSYLLMVRLNCKFLYEKSLLVLHRKYMTQGYESSTKACIDAAMAICTCFTDMHKEFQPGGQLYHDRWMLSSFTMNDFLLAAMILCLALSQWRKRHPGQNIEKDTAATEQIVMLRIAFEICQERSPTSTESRKVAEGLKAMLSQFSTRSAAATTMPEMTRSDSYTAWSDGMNLTPLSLKEAPMPQGRPDPDPNVDLGPFENFLEGAETIDWEYLDHYLVNPERNDQEATANSMVGQDWQSTPMPFLGHKNDEVSSYTLNETPLRANEPMMGNGTLQSGLTGGGGPEYGHMPRY